MKIRKVLASDLDAVMEIVDAARGIMRASGNMLQWTGGYPDKTVMTADIRRGVCYGCEVGGKLSAVFSMIPSPDPTYTDIYGGAWLNEEPYLVVHRIASLPECHGVMDAVPTSATATATTSASTPTATTPSCATACRKRASPTAASSISPTATSDWLSTAPPLSHSSASAILTARAVSPSVNPRQRRGYTHRRTCAA